MPLKCTRDPVMAKCNQSVTFSIQLGEWEKIRSFCNPRSRVPRPPIGTKQRMEQRMEHAACRLYARPRSARRSRRSFVRRPIRSGAAGAARSYRAQQSGDRAGIEEAWLGDNAETVSQAAAVPAG